MTSTYSADLKLELMVTGENAGTWGDNTNNNLNLIQQAIAGYEQVTLSSGGTLALAMTDKTISNARNMVIKFATATIAASTICTIPDSIEKFYIFDCTALTNPSNLTIKTASGTGFTPDAAKIYAAYSNGTNIVEVSLDTLGGTIGTAQIADDAITAAKIDDDAILSVAISDNAVLTAHISNKNVTTGKIADDAVTADKLADTAVTAASYTLASITVDAQGRLTAASSGTVSAANMGEVIITKGPASGTYTPHPSVSKARVFACAGGGGNGGPSQGWGSGGTGGKGGYGYYEVTPTGGTGYAYSVGSQGNNGNASSGNAPAGGAGGGTNVTNLLTVNGGNGGAGGRRSPPFTPSPGTAGTAPSATIALDPDDGFMAPGGTSGSAGFLIVIDNHIS